MNKPERILVCGGRVFLDWKFVKDTLYECIPHFEEGFVLIEGGANGVDRYAREWALSNGFPVITMYAAWDALGKPAGSIRNGWMLDYCSPDFVIAFPGGPGTANMVKRARAANVIVWQPTDPYANDKQF